MVDRKKLQDIQKRLRLNAAPKTEEILNEILKELKSQKNDQAEETVSVLRALIEEVKGIKEEEAKSQELYRSSSSQTIETTKDGFDSLGKAIESLPRPAEFPAVIRAEVANPTQIPDPLNARITNFREIGLVRTEVVNLPKQERKVKSVSISRDIKGNIISYQLLADDGSKQTWVINRDKTGKIESIVGNP